jgi:hypothetical protein
VGVESGDCLSPGCPNKPFRRGLCQRCYGDYLDEIDGGASEEAIVAAGLIRRRKPPGPQMSRAFGKALASIRK